MRQSLTNLLYPSLGWSTLYFTVSTHFLVRSSLQTAEHRQHTACDSGSSQLFVITPTTVVEITAHPGLNTSKPHTTGRLEAGFYTEVTQGGSPAAAAGHQSGRSPIRDGCGKTMLHRLLGTQSHQRSQDPQALSRMGWEDGKARQPMTTAPSQDIGLGTKKPSNIFGPFENI